MLLSHFGGRSLYLSKFHQKYRFISTGPNALSYGDLRAIKDIYGHNASCTKDGQYVVGAGSHYHLADVVDRVNWTTH
jgi:hypothetical protein